MSVNLSFEKGKIYEYAINFILNSCKFDKYVPLTCHLTKDEGGNYCVSDKDHSVQAVEAMAGWFYMYTEDLPGIYFQFQKMQD